MGDESALGGDWKNKEMERLMIRDTFIETTVEGAAVRVNITLAIDADGVIPLAVWVGENRTSHLQGGNAAWFWQWVVPQTVRDRLVREIEENEIQEELYGRAEL